MTFWITQIFVFLFFIMRTGAFSKCENQSGSQIGCQVKTWAVLISSENWTETQRQFSVSRWEPPNTDYDHNVLGKFIKFLHNKMQISSLPERRFSIMQEILLKIKISFFGYYDHNVLENFKIFPHNTMQISSLPETRFSIMQEIRH
jgi:hypothetical protein